MLALHSGGWPRFYIFQNSHFLHVQHTEETEHPGAPLADDVGISLRHTLDLFGRNRLIGPWGGDLDPKGIPK